MTTTPLPSYGIWTTDIDGKRVMGFTPEQFLPVWDDCAGLEAEVKRLREALEEIGRANAAQVAPVYSELARTALKETP